MATALDVQNGQVIIHYGYRCRVSNVRHETMETGEVIARYTLHSEPNDTYPHKLPSGYEGMNSGGNSLVQISE